jgi:hypothetical protein
VAIHAALLLIAARWVTRADLRREESLVFLALPDPVRTRTPAPVSPIAPTSASSAPRRKQAAPPDTQLITVPAPAQPTMADKTPAPIDWNAEADRTITQQAQLAMAAPPRALDKHGAGADLNGGLGPDRERKSDFGWDRSHTHQIEGIEGGGILMHINERCVLVLFPLPFGGCGIGKIPVRGDLFEHMHDVPDASSKNTTP